MSTATPVVGVLDLPTNEHRAEQDVCYAQRAVIVHAPEDWPSGRTCRNRGPRSRRPCPFQVWGVKTLLATGWSQGDIAHLVRRAEQGDVPW